MRIVAMGCSRRCLHRGMVCLDVYVVRYQIQLLKPTSEIMGTSGDLMNGPLRSFVSIISHWRRTSIILTLGFIKQRVSEWTSRVALKYIHLFGGELNPGHIQAFFWTCFLGNNDIEGIFLAIKNHFRPSSMLFWTLCTQCSLVPTHWNHRRSAFWTLRIMVGDLDTWSPTLVLVWRSA